MNARGFQHFKYILVKPIFSLSLQHFLGSFFCSRTTALPAAFPLVWAYGSVSNQWIQKSNAGKWNHSWSLGGVHVGESISLHKIHAVGMWLFSPEMITSCDQGLCKMGVDSVFTQQNEHRDYISEHLPNPLSNVDLFPFPTLWLLLAVCCLLFNLPGYSVIF